MGEAPDVRRAGDLAGRSVAELLELFASISREIETVDHVGRVNRLHDTRRRVVAAIRDRTDGTARALLPLVSHDDPCVRQSAARYYDEIEPNTKVAQDARAPRTPSPRDSRLSRHDAPAGMSRAELEPLLFDAFSREIASALMALARPAIRVWPQPLVRASDAGSHFGGMPPLPKNWPWPTTEVWPKSAGLAFLNMSREERGPMPQEPKWFLGQINCADLRGLLAAEELLPPSGIFSFFGDSDLVTGCTGPWDYGGLYFFSGDDLERAAEPIEDFKTLPTCGLAFSDAIDLPDPFSRVI